ncbi:MAG: endonuclease/exonuclease/phosphatase family protein [Shewanella sp.]
MLSTSSNSHYQLKIASFNLFNFIAPPNAFYEFDNIYTQQQWQKKLNWIAKYLNEHQPDVIAFQEVFSPDELETLTQACGLGYFSVLDSPQVMDDFIYSKPIVALASRYPIKETVSVYADKEWAAKMGLVDEFEFSRKPLRATVDLPKIGLCDCYVVHFKSKRPLFDAQDIKASSITSLSRKGALDTELNTGQLLAMEALGQWSSSVQRGSEAVLLRYAMVKRRSETQYPMILMGDFNDILSDGVLAGLTSVDSRIKPQADMHQGAMGGVAHQLEFYRLQDSYDLYQASQYSLSEQIRPATHYYFAKGSVLDYILLSSEFDAKNDLSLAEVGRYETYDRHLINPSFEHDSQSADHAPVMITLSIRG